MNQTQWQFWIDRGGNFTDIVAQRPDGSLLNHKLLSENPQHYQDAAIQGIRDIFDLAPDEPLPVDQIPRSKGEPRWQPMPYWNGKVSGK